MDWESCYCVMVDPSRNVDKHWQITRKGTRVLRQWGRRGMGPQQSVKDFSTVFRASEEMVNAVREKRDKGYVNGTGSIPLPPEFEKAGKPVDTREGYFLDWRAAKPISPDDIDAAVGITQRVLDEVAPSLPVELTIESLQAAASQFPDATWALIRVNGEEVAHFGFPSESFAVSLGVNERLAMLEQVISRDGWLDVSGCGVGMIETRRGWGDFPVRLLLSVLAANAALAVADVDDQDYGEHGFRFSAADHRDFAWCEHWEPVLKPAVRAHWIIEGEGIIVGEPSLEVSPFAW